MVAILAACGGTSTISGSSVKTVRANAGANAVQMNARGDSASNPADDVNQVNPPAQKPIQKPLAPVLAPAAAPRVQVQPGAEDRCSGGTGTGKAQPMCSVE
jgi:hypothetical protein